MAVPARHHNYAVAGAMFNAFAVGAVGAENDFWFVGLQPPEEGEPASRPLLCANLLDPFGRRLLTLERNVPTYNPKNCSALASEDAYRIVGPDAQDVLRVQTVWVKSLGYHVSYFHCRFKDRSGVVRMESRGVADAPSAMLHGRAAYGIRANATFARNDGLGEEQVRRVMEWAGMR